MKSIGLVVLAAALAFGPAAEARKSHSAFHAPKMHAPRLRSHAPRTTRIRHANGKIETCRRDASIGVDLSCR